MNPLFTVFSIAISIAVLVFLTVRVKLHPFFSLTAAAFTFGILTGQSIPDIIAAFSSGLGSTIAGIGIVIAIGTVMGALLEKSGAAETMAKTILKITGPKHAALGLAITGYFVSIPVFCDSAFVILSPLAKSLSRDTKVSMTTMAVSLAMGLHATHMLVPPTPGPLAVAGILNADLGLVILLGMVVSIPVTLVGYYLGTRFGSKYYYLPSDTEEIVTDKKLPGALQAFLPILLPILLMFLNTISSLESAPFGKNNFITSLFAATGQPVSALLIGLIFAFITYRSIYPEDNLVWTFDGAFGEALKTAGQIVLIVGAGGAFASVLRTSNLEEMVTMYFSGMTIGILIPFIIGAIFRTAIGSGTVGMITAASMLLPLLDILGFTTPMGRVIAMLACAAGGFMVFHGNDDFFWVITTTSEMKPEVAYRTLPIISIAQSLTAIVLVFILQAIFL
ncbi:Gluconate transporter [Tepidanaerobacter acetatoxydans Re1]|uniref:Gluconate transporter n=1 Tax=Tepidanaerobacter acetatoxydans (strain DSM 21804 / JCM 16047 / Re1) TaxID=1209989 RepID=F4LRK0_TEPAE|nr:GntP family permease [Tepidanaerobacter acetatoxydans]AEE90263.1 Gluconate transporter [Tepidanaerobacter acetatoxydans Re1]CCP24730.1 Gluconate transporter [Tepidanaerobacter acetatoxydans Re1]